MQQLQGNTIYLRALEPHDLEFLFNVENDSLFWEVSNTQTPYSKHLLEKYLANAHLDIYTAKQLRLVIALNKTNKAIGMVDLFDYNPQHHRAGIGILIIKEYQNSGYASEALELLIPYCFNTLNFHQLFANISIDNSNSMGLFKKFNFKKVGIKKQWVYSNGSYKDEVLFQLIDG
ncbi:MAG: GNAT family N-acetyltransferase [Flavobacteriaceae bacterium]|nr:GNAT family N-acetyltransferase [Flavobacteriaceae bacterium]